MIKGRVLVDGTYGKCNEVVELDEVVAQAAAKVGEVDIHPDAVAYAIRLKRLAIAPVDAG
jgi:hypothetical protein